MITQLNIENFKSLKKVAMPLGKITVLTGANNSGKSSIIYSVLVLKNVINNPNQSIDNCLTLPFINLGGFKETVFWKDEDLNINIGVVVDDPNIDAIDDIKIEYSLSIGKKASFLKLKSKSPYEIDAKIDVAFPYPANKFEASYFFLNLLRKIDIPSKVDYEWNGFRLRDLWTEQIESSKTIQDVINQRLEKAKPLIEKIFQSPINSISEIDFVPIRRGFTKPYFSPVPLQAQISTEDEYATLLATDRDLQGKVAHYLEKIVERSFSIHTTLGTSIFNLQTRDKKNGFTTDLVNEGLGTNQLVTILAKALQKNNKFICIDEPEIHLHPSIIDRLVSVIIDIAEKEGKQFLVSTHSEHFISSLLKNVAAKEIQPNDIKVYYLDKKGKETSIEPQAINENGQIEGGLKHFYNTELSNLETLFKITD